MGRVATRGAPFQGKSGHARPSSQKMSIDFKSYKTIGAGVQRQITLFSHPFNQPNGLLAAIVLQVLQQIPAREGNRHGNNAKQVVLVGVLDVDLYNVARL